MLTYSSYEDMVFHGGENTLEIVLKITERCNLACSYCYYYFSGNDGYKSRPSLLKKDVLAGLAKFLSDGIDDLNLTVIQIDFHGGEPMLVKPDSFKETCETLIEAVGDRASLQFSMQTNATLVTPEWIDVLSEFSVSVGISVDGPAEIHDRFRVDHKGRPSHHKTVQGVELILDAVKQGRLKNVGALCVVEPDNDAVAVFDHLIDDLKLHDINFLLPDYGTTIYDGARVQKLDTAIQGLLKRWKERRGEGVKVTMFDSAREALTSGVRPDVDINVFQRLKSFILTVYSDGTVGALDELLSVAPHLFETGLNVRDHSLREVLSHPDIKKFAVETAALPSACEECCWRSACHGGQEVNRYDADMGFKGKSRHCEVLASMYATMARDAIVDEEVSMPKLARSLNLEASEL